MKPYYSQLATLVAAVVTVLALGACSKTSNSSDPTTAVTPGTCTMNAYGQYVDQYGRACSTSTLNYNCSTYTYTGGTPYCGSQYTLPPNGYYNYGGNNYYVGGGSYGCQQWSQYYGQIYVPVNLGGGQLMCVSWAYLQSYSNSNWGYYTDPSYWYSQPPSVYSGDVYYGNGGYYGDGGYYGNYCQSNLNFGFSSGGFGAGVSLCL